MAPPGFVWDTFPTFTGWQWAVISQLNFPPPLETLWSPVFTIPISPDCALLKGGNQVSDLYTVKHFARAQFIPCDWGFLRCLPGITFCILRLWIPREQGLHILSLCLGTGGTPAPLRLTGLVVAIVVIPVMCPLTASLQHAQGRPTDTTGSNTKGNEGIWFQSLSSQVWAEI